MNFRKAFLQILLFSLTVGMYGQQQLINQLDQSGKKTGVWETYYESGKVKSHGTFKNGHPVGELKKFYPGGILQAAMNFDESGRTSYVKLFYEAGHLASEGKYIDQLKDSVWNYYSAYDKRKAVSETFQQGKKEGDSYKYYMGGKPSEYLEYKNDLKNGKWEQYFETGQKRLTGHFLAGMLDGSYVCYNPDSSLSITGSYKAGAMDGTWTYYNETGDREFAVEYVNGLMLPNEEMDKRIEEFSKKVKESIGNLDEVEINEYQ
jgi:antitoxin component YwqK of YwqJK toxin-antitoxin module